MSDAEGSAPRRTGPGGTSRPLPRRGGFRAARTPAGVRPEPVARVSFSHLLILHIMPDVKDELMIVQVH